MNGVHDMGGMQSFGPVVVEDEEPVFHHAWEGRALGMVVLMGATRQWNLDQSRSARESLPPAKYLSSSYYKIWIEGLCKLMVERELLTHEELADGVVRTDTKPLANVLRADQVPAALARGSSTQRLDATKARFAVGDVVRSRNLNPSTHTRLPRYCREKPGIITKVHGTHVFPDSHALGREDPQWLYTVRFDAAALWGSNSTASAVFVDCWEPYLEAR
jgi:nitrile hydratase beta subunit